MRKRPRRGVCSTRSATGARGPECRSVSQAAARRGEASNRTIEQRHREAATSQHRYEAKQRRDVTPTGPRKILQRSPLK
jgi:hypothetical protein